MNADVWKGLACDFNNVRVDFEKKLQLNVQLEAAREMWRSMVETTIRRLLSSCRDFNTTKFMMLAGYTKLPEES